MQTNPFRALLERPRVPSQWPDTHTLRVIHGPDSGPIEEPSRKSVKTDKMYVTLRNRVSYARVLLKEAGDSPKKQAAAQAKLLEAEAAWFHRKNELKAMGFKVWRTVK